MRDSLFDCVIEKFNNQWLKETNDKAWKDLLNNVAIGENEMTRQDILTDEKVESLIKNIEEEQTNSRGGLIDPLEFEKINRRLDEVEEKLERQGALDKFWQCPKCYFLVYPGERGHRCIKSSEMYTLKSGVK
jgi:hypothetical protein